MIIGPLEGTFWCMSGGYKREHYCLFIHLMYQFVNSQGPKHCAQRHVYFRKQEGPCWSKSLWREINTAFGVAEVIVSQAQGKGVQGSVKASPRLLPEQVEDGATLGGVEGLVRLEPLTHYLGMFSNLLLGSMDTIVYLGGL